MSFVTVRQATLEDLESVTYLFDLYRQFYTEPSDLAGARHYLRTRMTQKDSVIFVAETELGTLAGFTQLYPSFSSLGMSRIWILNDLYVLEIHRQKKIAEELMRAVHIYAQSTGATSISLETHPDNKKAQALYKKLGYQIVDDFVMYSLTLKSH